MSDKAEELAKQILEKTNANKLIWNPVSGSVSESYQSNLEGVFSFCISRTATGDNKILGFEVNSPSGIVLSAQADNFPMLGANPYERSRRMMGGGDKGTTSEPVDTAKIARFRLFSDLFHAARANAVAEDQTIEKVQQLLERLA
jgi:hypothetical protein